MMRTPGTPMNNAMTPERATWITKLGARLTEMVVNEEEPSSVADTFSAVAVAMRALVAVAATQFLAEHPDRDLETVRNQLMHMAMHEVARVFMMSGDLVQVVEGAPGDERISVETIPIRKQ